MFSYVKLNVIQNENMQENVGLAITAAGLKHTK